MINEPVHRTNDVVDISIHPPIYYLRLHFCVLNKIVISLIYLFLKRKKKHAMFIQVSLNNFTGKCCQNYKLIHCLNSGINSMYHSISYESSNLNVCLVG